MVHGMTELRLRRQAERVLVGGTLVHPHAPHGVASSYANFSCRCKPCCQAHTEKVADLRQRRKAQRGLVDGRMVHPTAEHGKGTTYTNYACRCQPCTDAHLIDNRKANA